MTDMIIFLIVIAVLFLLYLWNLRCRKGHPGLDALRGWLYAHRGLHGNGVPENSMAAFRLARDAGFGIELDIHLMADGNLAVIHDPSLKRTAGADVHIEDLTAQDLPKYPLENTTELIPLFSEVLELYAGKAPLIIELKPERGNHAALCAAACKAMEGYEGAWCMESFDPRCVYWLKKNRTDIIRGQLAENFFRTKTSILPWYLKLVMSKHLTNFLTRPDFLAYKFADRRNLGLALSRKVWKTQGVTWTVKTPQDLKTAQKEGYIPIFEGFTP